MPEPANNKKLIEEIKRLKLERKAVILSHVYQAPEVQEIADHVGDSLELSRWAANTGAEVIVFCGVHFMAESAAILSPEKIVLLPDPEAGCPMADMVTTDALRARKREIPGVIVVSYVNTTAGVKAESDIACTSANAARIINSLPPDKPILFVPDRNLGMNVSAQTGRDMMYWDGFCCIHDNLTVKEVLAARERYPRALLLAHPECTPEVVALADYVSSTTGMLRYARESSHDEFIVATEVGIMHQFRKQCPGKKFYEASADMVCRNMKATTLEKVHRALLTLEPRVAVPSEIRTRALRCLEKMLAAG
ncbi:MAG: quinolinate synthase NadA [Bacillota bacterium]